MDEGAVEEVIEVVKSTSSTMLEKASKEYVAGLLCYKYQRLEQQTDHWR